MEGTLGNKPTICDVLDFLPQKAWGMLMLSFSPGKHPLGPTHLDQKEHLSETGPGDRDAQWPALLNVLSNFLIPVLFILGDSV